MSRQNPDLEIWQRFQAQLKRSSDEATYDVWLSPLSFGGFDGRTLAVKAPLEQHKWIVSRFMDLLSGVAEDVLGECSVQILTEGETPVMPAPDHAPLEHQPEKLALNAQMTFDQFVIGEANRLAHAASLAVAEAPGAAYNPLFIYGPPGVGKTHLLHAIGNYANEFGGGLKVHYATAESFTNEFVAALKNKGISRFKTRYRSNDLLLIDDVQFLQSKAQTEEEFFHTFNTLQESGAQIVITSDRAPEDLAGVQERLRARFGSGLLVDVEGPDAATRRLVLRKRIHHDGVSIESDEVSEFIAERVTGSVRALEGALIRVAAYASLQGRPVDVKLARQVLDRLYPERRREVGSVSIQSIQKLVADAYGVTVDELKSASRSALVAWPRHVAIFLCREHTSATFHAIGSAFGGRDHSTVVYSCGKVKQELAADPEKSEMVRRLTEMLLGGHDDRGN